MLGKESVKVKHLLQKSLFFQNPVETHSSHMEEKRSLLEG